MEKKDKVDEKESTNITLQRKPDSIPTLQNEESILNELKSLTDTRMKRSKAHYQMSTLSFTTLSTLRKEPTYVINTTYRRKCAVIAICVILQCLAVFVGSYTILHCFWSPDHVKADFNKLIRIMYLYDYQVCESKMHARKKAINNIVLGRDTSIKGMSIRLFKSTKPVLTVSTRLTEKTRLYIQISIVMHVAWMLTAMVMWLFCELSVTFKRFKLAMTVFMLASSIMVAFDTSMAIVYIAHIQQTVNKGMILRYSGWSGEIILHDSDAFAGWIPMCASACWMRGIVFEVLNIYSLNAIRCLRTTLIRGELNVKVVEAKHSAIPEPCMRYTEHEDTFLQRQS